MSGDGDQARKATARVLLAAWVALIAFFAGVGGTYLFNAAALLFILAATMAMSINEHRRNDTF